MEDPSSQNLLFQMLLLVVLTCLNAFFAASEMSMVSLKQLDAPCILYTLNGYYNDLQALLRHMIEMGPSTKERQEGICFADDLAGIQEILRRFG